MPANQTTLDVKKDWSPSARSAMAAIVAALPTFGNVNVNPPNLAAGARADVVVALPAGTCGVSDFLDIMPPDTLEAGLVATRWWISAVDQMTLTIYNPTAGAIDGANLAWSYCVTKAPKLRTI